MKYVLPLLVGTLFAFGFSAAVASEAEVGLIAAAEFLFLAGLFLLLGRVFRLRVSHYAVCGVALLIVMWVSVSTQAAVP